MTTVDLFKLIEALPEPDREEVVRFIDSLRARTAAETPEHLYDRIVGRAERIFSLHGPLGDSTSDLRELRDNRR